MTTSSLRETRTPSMIVGCDPGKSGALARLDHAGAEGEHLGQYWEIET